MPRINEKPQRLEVGVLNWIKQIIDGSCGQVEFSKIVGLSKDVLNAKLNGRSPIFKSDWEKWFKNLIGYEWNDKFNDIPEGLSPEDYDKHVQAIRNNTEIGLHYLEWDHVDKTISEAIFKFAGKRITRSEIFNFKKYLEDMYINITEVEVECQEV